MNSILLGLYYILTLIGFGNKTQTSNAAINNAQISNNAQASTTGKFSLENELPQKDVIANPSAATASVFMPNENIINNMNTNSNANNNTNITPRVFTVAKAEKNMELVYFSVKEQDCEVTLHWQTASEAGSKEFIVQRSTVGNGWVKIGCVAGAGTSNSTQNYSFTDLKPMRQNAYRLVQLDNDGHPINFTNINKVQTAGCYEGCKEGETILYPNPITTHQAWMKFYSEHGEEEATVLVTDILGNTLQTQKTIVRNGANIVGINVANLPDGHYYLQVQGNGWSTDMQKLIRIKIL